MVEIDSLKLQTYLMELIFSFIFVLCFLSHLQIVDEMPMKYSIQDGDRPPVPLIKSCQRNDKQYHLSSELKLPKQQPSTHNA